MNEQIRQLITHMQLSVEASLRTVLPPGFTPEMIRERCLLETHGDYELVFLDGKPLLRIGPPVFTHERDGFSWKLRVSRAIYTYTEGPMT